MKWTSKQTPPSPEINLTPLIDVVFMVLILFILIAPILNIENIELFAKKSSTKMVHFENQKLKLYIFKDNTIWLNKQKLDPKTLTEMFTFAKTKLSNQTPILICDKQAFFGTYELVKTALEDAGFDNINLVLKPR